MDVDDLERELEVEFNNEFDMNEYKCIEIDPDLLNQLSNGCLEIRGSQDDEAVLVTKDKTFKIRQADFSNTQLLLLPDQTDYDDSFEFPKRVITGAISCHYILAPQPPQVAPLYQLLSTRVYKGENNEGVVEDDNILDDDDYDMLDDDDRKRNKEKIDLSFENLKNLIQASDKEILDALHDMDAIEINGEWRLLDSEYLVECFEDCINTITGTNMPYNAIDIDTLYALIREDDEIEGDYPKQIINHCIAMHSQPREEEHKIDENNNDNSKNETSDTRYCLDVDKVCLFVGKQILLNNGKDGKMNKQEFIMEWVNTVPDDIRSNCKLELLTGHALVFNDPKSINNNNQPIVELFEEKELSPDPKHRFEQLFKKKKEWTMKEIEPYLKTLEKGGVKVDKLLLKNTRTVRKRDKDNKEYRVFASRNVRL